MRKLVAVIVGALMIAVGLSLAAGVLHLGLHASQEHLPRDMAGDVVIPEGDAPVDPTAVHQVEDHRLVIPSVGLDVPLGETRTVGGVVNPPGYQSAYVVRDLGTDGGTTFVAMHSLRNGGLAPGNALFEAGTGRVLVEPGDVILLAGREYRTTHSFVLPSEQVDRHPEVWADRPGRLVLITCLQNPEGTPSVARVIVAAQRSDLPAPRAEGAASSVVPSGRCGAV